MHPLYNELLKNSHQTSLVVTGSHLHAQSQFSAEEIESDIGNKYCKVYITPDNGEFNNRELMFATMAGALSKFPAFLDKIKPDLVIYLGDRYETYAIATVCRLCGIRSAHISGGELTAGAFDNELRHCISKLSDLHFTATEEYRRRVIQLGENPDRVFNAGELGLADLDLLPFLPQQQLEALLNCSLNDFFLITLHPQTCSPGLVLNELENLLLLLRKNHPQTRLVFTGANADPEGEEINRFIRTMAEQKPESISYFCNLGRLNYLSVARLARCVIGNSSSGIVEVPALGIPVLNLGRRQHGRPHGRAVVTADFAAGEIEKALSEILTPGFREQCAGFSNPYEGKDSARKIARIIEKIDLATISREKHFYDL